jgi:UPF0755 protein
MRPGKIILFSFLVLLVAAAYVSWNFFGPTIQAPNGNYFYIHTGASYKEVKDSLKKEKMIGSDFWFEKVASYSHYDKNIRPGKYKITDGMSIVGLVSMLRNGRQVPVNLIITKLRTKEDLAKKIGDNFETDSLSAIKFLNNNDSLRPFGVDTNTVLTIVIRNTYTYKWNTSITSVLKKLYIEEKKFWNEDREKKAKHLGLSPKEVYTLASIVEEETNRSEDKGKIASVYINRVRKGMKLAADPTIKFAMKEFGLKRIYFKYLDYPSPYNTYIHKGLPPGPINSPSINTIDAVLDEPQTNYLFFAARPNSGGLSDFSTTFSEHAAYAKRYRLALDSLAQGNKENQ